jgi:hypothetical protein
MESSHRHRRESGFAKIKREIDRSFQRLFGSGSPHSTPSERDFGRNAGMQTGMMHETAVPQSPSQGQEPDQEHHHRSGRKRNSLRSYIMRRLERYADKVEARREQRNKRKFLQAMKKRHRKEESKKKVNIFKSLFNRFFERKSHHYGYYTNEGVDKEKVELKRQRKRLVFFSINSLIIFLLAYLITYLTYQLAVMFAASRYGINSILLYYEVFFPIGNYSDKWNVFNIIIITFAGPLLSVIMGSIYLLLFVRKETITGLRRLFFFWLGFHSINFFLGGFVGGVITSQGFGYVIAWMFLPTVIKFGLAIVCLFVLGLIGFLYTRYFLEFSGSFYWTKRSNKLVFIIFTAAIPWAVGTLILFVMKYPKVLPQHENIVIYDSIIYVSMVFVVAGMMVNFKAEPMLEKGLRKEGRRINWVYLVILAGLLVLFRLGLNTGFYYLAP